MTNVVPNGMPNDSPLDALPVDASDWDEVPAEAAAEEATENQAADDLEPEDLEIDVLELDELELAEPEPDDFGPNELELDESAIVNEEWDDLFFDHPQPRTTEEDYTIRHEEHAQTITTDDRETARLRISYYETWRDPPALIEQEPLAFQKESATWHEKARSTLPLPDEVHAQINQKLRRQAMQRLSLREIFGFTTLVAIALAAASWMPLNVYTLLLGWVTLALLIAVLNRILKYTQPGRHIWISLIALLVIYIGSIIITLIRQEVPSG